MLMVANSSRSSLYFENGARIVPWRFVNADTFRLCSLLRERVRHEFSAAWAELGCIVFVDEDREPSYGELMKELLFRNRCVPLHVPEGSISKEYRMCSTGFFTSDPCVMQSFSAMEF